MSLRNDVYYQISYQINYQINYHRYENYGMKQHIIYVDKLYAPKPLYKNKSIINNLSNHYVRNQIFIPITNQIFIPIFGKL